MLVTKMMLRRMKACESQVEAFEELFPSGAEWNDRADMERAYCTLNLPWFIKNAFNAGIVPEDQYKRFLSESVNIKKHFNDETRENDSYYFSRINDWAQKLNEIGDRVKFAYVANYDVIAELGKELIEISDTIRKARDAMNDGRAKIANDRKNSMIDLLISIPLRSFPRKKKS